MALMIYKGGRIMSNDTFEKIYKKYDSMINSFVRKYNGLLEADEIRQCCLIAILKSHKTYNCHRDMKFETWIYQNMQWEVYREIRDTKHLTKDCVSLQTPLNASEEDNITLEDTLQDNTNIEVEIEDKIMIDYYLKECERILPSDKFDVCYLKWFKGCSNTYIAETTNRKSINDVLRQSRSLLLTRSRVLNAEYRKLVGISEYNTERIAIM